MTRRTATWMLALFGMILMLPGTFPPAEAAAPDYFGELCWQVVGSPDTVRFGITHMGDGYFMVTGKLIEISFGETNLITGTGAVVDGELHVHLTSSGIYANDNAGSLSTMVVDLDTLDGYVETVGMYVTRASSSGDITYDGTINLSFIPCP